MSNIVLVPLCLFLGFLLRQLGRFPENAPQVLNSFVIHVSLPALVLVQIPALLDMSVIDAAFLLPVSMAWLLFPLSFITFHLMGRKLGWSKAKTGTLVLTAGLANTSFVGFPLLEALIGPHALRIGILVDQPGSFLVVSTVGIATAAWYAGDQVAWQQIARRVLAFPPFLSIVAAVLIWIMGFANADSAHMSVFSKLAGTLVPLALISVGFQLKIGVNVLRRRWRGLLPGLTFKLIFAPIFFLILYVFLLEQRSFASRVTVLESAMAPMITSAIVAAEFRLDAELAQLMVGAGILLSLLTVPAWSFVLSYFF